MAYALTPSTEVIRLKDGAVTPADPGNIDRQAFDTWCAQGGVPRPAEPAPAPPPRRILTVLAFRERLTPEEGRAITAAGMASVVVRVWLDRLSGAQEVNLDDPGTVAGLHAMASLRRASRTACAPVLSAMSPVVRLTISRRTKRRNHQ